MKFCAPALMRAHEVGRRGHEGREQLRPQLVLARHRGEALDALGVENDPRRSRP